ncbi:MAG: hypothetical protein ABEI86_10335, partial [Halobacteriaceae archaeon]
MKYHDIPKYDKIQHWYNANGQLEVKLKYDIETQLHLVESMEQPDQIEDECFYGKVGYDDFGGIIWVREAE